MILHDVKLIRADGEVRLVGEIESASGKRLDTYFAFPERFEEFVSVTADPFAVTMLPPAMAAGESVEIVPPVSPQLLLSLHRVRDMLDAWFPEFHHAEIQATPRARELRPLSGRAATFFSGGVDSFYTLLKYLRAERLPAPMTHVIFMRGIETRLELVKGFEDSLRLNEEIARELGVEVIVGETNIRTTSRLHWEKRYVGSGLAATALALAGGLDYVCVPSGASYLDLLPRGSSPLIEERFSSEDVRILTDGAEVSRAEKVGRIVEWDRDTVLNYLRVCIENDGGAYNCGECYKCVRTAVALAASGAWDDARNFRNRSKTHWERSARNDQRNLVAENQRFAHQVGADPALTAMLDRVVRRHERSLAVRTLVAGTPAERLIPLVSRIRNRIARV